MRVELAGPFRNRVLVDRVYGLEGNDRVGV